jgi:hypothetical protein
VESFFSPRIDIIVSSVYLVASTTTCLALLPMVIPIMLRLRHIWCHDHVEILSDISKLLRVMR